MARTHVLALLSSAAILLAGCAGSAAPPPAYVAAADAICTAQLAQLDRLPEPATPEQAVTYIPQAIAILEREKSGLAALEPPGRVREQFAAGLAGQGQLAAMLRHVSEELRSGLVEVGTLSRAQAEGQTLRADINAHFRQAGLVRCAR
jgi:hypothetical protein